jgi:hypothetical protein
MTGDVAGAMSHANPIDFACMISTISCARSCTAEVVGGAV